MCALFSKMQILLSSNASILRAHELGVVCYRKCAKLQIFIKCFATEKICKPVTDNLKSVTRFQLTVHAPGEMLI